MAFELPQLPYPTNGLEPHVDTKTMEIHHGKHHAGYTAKLNAAIEGTELEGKTIEEILYKKSKIAFEEFKKMNTINKNKFVVAGGVAANKKIREVLTNLCLEEEFEAIFPPVSLCGDNAAMIAMVGLEKFKLKQFSNLDHPAKPRWPLDEDAAFLKGAGVQL